jgi:2-haloacid dehalogenase
MMNLSSINCATVFLIAIVSTGDAFAPEPSTPQFKAVAFDHFVIFDPNSVVPAVEEAYPGKGVEFTRAWRAKQFEYSFLGPCR